MRTLEELQSLVAAFPAPLSSHEALSGSRNENFHCITEDGQHLHLKIYNTSARGSSKTECWMYQIFQNSGLVKKFILAGKATDDTPFILTEYIVAPTLKESLENSILPAEQAEMITSSICKLIDDCQHVPIKGFGRFKSDAEFSEATWDSALFSYLARLNARINRLPQEKRQVIAANFNRLHRYFFEHKAELQSVEANLIPVDLNSANFLLTPDGALKLIDLESVWGGDILIAYGDWLANVENTTLGNCFIQRVLSTLAAPLQERVLAYACLSNLSALVFIAEQTDESLNNAHPWGNTGSTYTSMVETRLARLDSKKKTLNPESKQTSSHFSFRNNPKDPRARHNLIPWDEMCDKTSALLHEVRRFCAEEFSPEEPYFVLFYGSYAYRLAKPTSDLDIIFFSEETSDERLQRIIDFIKELHQRHGMSTDDEIPYELKTLISFKQLKHACEAEGIYTQKEGYRFPQITKDNACLTSASLIQRFLLGMLANPHVFASGKFSVYEGARKTAVRNLIRALVNIHDKQEVTVNELVQFCCNGPNQETGDYFLGFSDAQPFTQFLLEFLESTLSSLGLRYRSGDAGWIYTVTTLLGQVPEPVADDLLERQPQFKLVG